MATFAVIPQEMLEKILQFLPLRDKINSGLVCANWNEVVGCNLQHITIDASVPYGGRWLEENMKWIGARQDETVPSYGKAEMSIDYKSKVWYREPICLIEEMHTEPNDIDPCDIKDDKKVWYRDENDPADKEMKTLLSRLCKITNEVKTLDIQNFQLSIDVLAELFSNLTGIKTLRIKDIFPISFFLKEVYFETIFQGIVKHQQTLEVIEIEINASCPGLFVINRTDEEKICKESLSFPRLKSLKLSTEVWVALEDLREDLLLALIRSDNLEETAIECMYQQSITVPHLVKNDTLRFLKKFSWTDFNFKTNAEHVEQLITCCPNIIHFDVFTDYFCKTGYNQGVLQIISTFGPQLKHFGCTINCSEIMRAILEKCKSLESLWLIFSLPSLQFPSDAKDEIAVITHLLPALGSLEKLTNIQISLGDTTVDNFEPNEIVQAEPVCELIEKCGTNLKVLTLQFDGTDSFQILNAIGAYCKNLVKLQLAIADTGAAKEDPLRASQLKESGEAIMEGCQKLIALHLDVREGDQPILYDQISNKLPHLKTLTFSNNISEYPQSDLAKLIQKLPYCKIGNLLW